MGFERHGTAGSMRDFVTGILALFGCIGVSVVQLLILGLVIIAAVSLASWFLNLF